MAGTFGTRKEKCVHGHSLEDAYIYKKEKNGNIYTIRECRTCRCNRNTQFKARKRKVKPTNTLKGMRSVAALLDCGHEIIFKPMPLAGDIVWCMDCSSYSVRVARKAGAKADAG